MTTTLSLLRIICRSAIALALGFCAGCGPKHPAQFTVSGQPIEHWLAEIKHANPRQRAIAVDRLGNVGPAHPSAIPALIEALSDAEPEVRQKACLALLKSGRDAKDAIPALTKAGSDTDPQVQDFARKALARIEGK